MIVFCRSGSCFRVDFSNILLYVAGLEMWGKIVLKMGEKTAKIDPETITNGVGNWVLLFVRLKCWKTGDWGWLREAWAENS